MFIGQSLDTGHCHLGARTYHESDYLLLLKAIIVFYPKRKPVTP